MLKPYLNSNVIEAGCDEAGRGCLAGPVFAASVILPSDFNDPLINDSKQLSHKQRMQLRRVIEQYAIDWAVASVSNREIDQINILNASIQAMQKAVGKLSKIRPQHLLIDGNRFKPFPGIPHTCIVKGDSLFLSIAAASILAKTYRDEFMEKISKEFPLYGWETNKGYPTRKHRESIAKYGTTPYHRKSFRLL
ncbi:MAG TPA: ribonuclease HII [Bacteroidales bacterium]|nr:ribonuclease HII [Bacteroidales bacterium]